MGSKRSLLEQMRANPKGDWNINDVEKVCTECGCELRPPSTGSHYIAVSHRLLGHMTIPARRPIKPIYIRHLVHMIDSHLSTEQEPKKKGSR